jgi:hypothetical protein
MAAKVKQAGSGSYLTSNRYSVPQIVVPGQRNLGHHLSFAILTVAQTIATRRRKNNTIRFTGRRNFFFIQRGTFSRYECEEALIEYLNLSIEEALQSENIFINALAMFDSRLGKRRLAFLASDKSRHPLVSKFYQPGQDAETQT